MDSTTLIRIVSGLVVILPFFALHIVFFWLVCKKAGLSRFLSLLCLIPYAGPFIVLCVLAFSRWKVVPAPPLDWALTLPPQIDEQKPAVKEAKTAQEPQ
jgi:hypothetical protein